MDNFQMVFQLGLNSLALEAAKISYANDEQNKEVDPAKIAEVLYEKYQVAYKFFGEQLNQSRQKQ